MNERQGGHSRQISLVFVTYAVKGKLQKMIITGRKV